MDIHLDDRLLHGRIIHGWCERIESRRCLLVSARMTDPATCGLYRAVAEDAGLSLLCVTPELAAAELEAEDFVLTDRPACVASLLDAGLVFDELIITGLRDEAGEICGKDILLSAETKDLLFLC